MALPTNRLQQLGIFVILSEDFLRKKCVRFNNRNGRRRERAKMWKKIHRNSIFFEHLADIFHILFPSIGEKDTTKLIGRRKMAGKE